MPAKSDRTWRFEPEGAGYRALRERDGLRLGWVEEHRPRSWRAWPNPEAPIYHREEDVPREFSSRDTAAAALASLAGPAPATARNP